MQRCKVYVTGASGAGATTLARAVADVWAVPHADTDDYFWVPTDPPYVEARPAAERVALMRTVFVPRPAWVLSGSMLGWEEDVATQCDAVVFLTLAPEERLRRLVAREEQRRGSDFDPESDEFLAWARGYDDPHFGGRSRTQHEEWLATLSQPVLRLDSASTRDELCDAVLRWEPVLP